MSAQLIEERAAHSAERRVFVLADALVGGDAREATLTYLRLRRQGERLGGLAYLMASRCARRSPSRCACRRGSRPPR